MTLTPLALQPPSSGSVPSPRPLGTTEPRLWTRPLRELTPSTSYGFGVIEFARDILGTPLDPWEEWAAIHIGELLPDGRPRFRQVLILVARQNGKTHLVRVLTLYWMFVMAFRLVVGTSTNLEYARESWQTTVNIAKSNEVLAPLVDKVLHANGKEELATIDGCRYKIAASNRNGGRSLSIDGLILDELREHHDWSAYSAAVPATNARPHAQIVAITNMGDDNSVVLNSMRDSALQYIATGQGDYRLGLFEWSAPEGADLDDVQALAQANPNAGRRIDWDTLLGAALRAKLAGGEEEAVFRTEVMCQRVRQLNPAIDPQRWAACLQAAPMPEDRSRVAMCVDVARDGRHATLVAAVRLPDGRVRVEPVAAWDGEGALAALRADLPGFLARSRPAALGWFPGGPAASLAAEFATSWTRPGMQVAAITSDTTSVCMGFAEQVDSAQVVHSGDALLDSQLFGTEKLHTGDRWVFSRRGSGYCDAVYATAGAVHLARTAPPPLGRPRILTA